MDRFRGKPTLILSLLLMIVVIIAMYFTQTMAGFFVVGAIAGIAMAGIQSVSRTMVAFLHHLVRVPNFTACLHLRVGHRR